MLTLLPVSLKSGPTLSYCISLVRDFLITKMLYESPGGKCERKPLSILHEDEFSD